MSFPALKEARGKYQAARKELADVFAQAGPDRDMSRVTSIQGSSEDKVDWIRTKNTEVEAALAEVRKLEDVERAAGNASDGSVETGDGSDSRFENRTRESLGRAFVNSAAFKNKTATAHLDVDIRNTLMERTAGFPPESTRTGIVTMFPTRPAPAVVDFIPQLPTGQAAVKYMEETTFTNNAAEAAEGGAYGEAALVLTERNVTVEKIAVWLPITDEQLEDEEMAEAYVEQRLGFMTQQRLDSQVLVGNGTTPNLRGTENVVGIQTQALGADTTEDAIYKLFTSIEEDGFATPGVVFIRPSKWQTVRLRKTSDGIYIWGPPNQPGPDSVWGVPVVKTTAVTASKAVAGDYATHSFLAIRRGIDVQVTNSHSDFFVSGKQAIRADMRAAMVHLRPKAFGAVTGL